MSETPEQREAREWREFQEFKRFKQHQEAGADSPAVDGVTRAVREAAQPQDMTLHGVLTVVISLIFPPAAIVVGLFLNSQANAVTNRTGQVPAGKPLIQAGIIVGVIITILFLLYMLWFMQQWNAFHEDFGLQQDAFDSHWNSVADTVQSTRH